MKRNHYIAVLLSLTGLCAFMPVHAADPIDEPTDSLRDLQLESALVTASPKEHAHFRQQPLSATLLGSDDIARRAVSSPKGLTAIVPNLYMPDYGSRLTGAIYVRGVGSRIGTPSVGLYVDNVSFADKSLFDFDFADVAHIEVLRGPQGSLYGRGAMSGLIRVTTADPLLSSGTRIHLGASGRNSGRLAQATTYLHPLSNLAVSLSGFYTGESGFFRNRTSGRKADSSDAAGGRIRLAWQASESLRFDFASHYEHSREHSNPYFYEGAVDPADEAYADQIGTIGQNRQSHYRRDMWQTSLSTTLRRAKYTMSSIAAYQYSNDDLMMDQDFLRTDIFSLNQRQRLHNVSEELVFKGLVGDRWEWTAGAFAMYGRKRVTCPVVFYDDGVAFLNRNFAQVMPSFVSVRFTDPTLPLDVLLKNTDANVALFHQSTLRRLFVKGLSLTVGLRLDYDYHRLSLHAPDTPYNYNFDLSMPAFGLDIHQPFSVDASFGGTHRHTHWQVLPKVAVQYDLPADWGNVYFSVTKGYRSGGYNMENYSDISQSLLRRRMMLQVKDFSTTTIANLPGLPESSKQTAIGGMTAMIDQNLPAESRVDQLAYAPEYSWNHEIGAHLNFFNRRLTADVSLFALRTHDLQLAHFADNGFGREIYNAGTARTLGLEVSLQSSLFDERLVLSGSYGYADSRFTDYNLGQTNGVDIDYKDNYVPYAPRHTVAVGAFFRQPLSCSWLKAVGAGIDARATGEVWWDEANTFKSPLTAQMGAQVKLEFAHRVSLVLWGRNLTDCRYATFSFDTLRRRFAQRGNPRHFGIDLYVAL